MKSNELKNRYKKYDKSVTEWMDALIDDLESEIGEIPRSYIMQLDILAQNAEIVIKSKREIDEHGLIVDSPKSGRVKSPAISVWNAANLTVCKLLSQFAMTRTSKAKLSATIDDTSCGMDEYINNE